MDIQNKEDLEKYYKEPVICILRIRESVELMLKKNGENGYFDFIENMLGAQMPNDDKMNYSIYIGSEKAD